MALRTILRITFQIFDNVLVRFFMDKLEVDFNMITKYSCVEMPKCN